jgi:hypothetical protein
VLIVVDHGAVACDGQKVVAMPAGLQGHEEPVQGERHDGGKRELWRREHGSRGRGREVRDDHAERGEGGHRRKGRTRSLGIERDNRSAACPHEDRQANDAVAREDDGGKHRISRERLCRPGARDHQRDDERHLDHRHGDSEDERSVWLTNAVSDDLRMMDRSENSAREHDCDDADDRWRKIPTPAEREDNDRGERNDRSPGEQRRALRGHAADR